VGIQCVDATERAKLKCYTKTDPEAYRRSRCVVAWNENIPQTLSSSRLEPYSPVNSSTTATTPLFFGSYYANWTSNLDASVWTIPPLGRLDIEWVRATDLLLSNNNLFYDMGKNSSLESEMCKLYAVLHKVSAAVNLGVYKEEIEQVSTNAEESSEP
jgi:hypothetical protein